MLAESAFSDRLAVVWSFLSFAAFVSCSPAPRASAAPDRPAPAPSASPRPASEPAAAASTGSSAEDDPFERLDEDDARPPSIAACFELRGADDCLGTGAVMLGCNALGNLLTEAPKERFVGCLRALSGSERLCRANVLRECALAAIEPTPRSAPFDAVCADIVPRCPPPESVRDIYTTDWCGVALASLRETSRRELVECMERHCDLTLCASQLW